MRKVRANIQKDKVEILSNIETLLTELTDPHSGLKSWSGSSTLTTGKYLEPGDACHLLLEDGRSGDFFVTNINIGTGPPDVEKKRDKALLVRLEGTEQEAFRDEANLAGVPLSSWVRERLRKIAATELKNASRPVAFLQSR